MLDYRGHQSMHLLTLVLCQSVLRKNRFAIPISSSLSSYQVSTQTGCSGLREGVTHLEALAPAVPGSQEAVTVAPSFCYGSLGLLTYLHVQRQQPLGTSLSEYHFHQGIHNHATCYLVETRCLVGLIYPGFTLLSIVFLPSLSFIPRPGQFPSDSRYTIRTDNKHSPAPPLQYEAISSLTIHIQRS
ncbi:hypothetical protein HDV62DRAFT_78895 [Trichoderma sp. SZMC 28011]